MLDVVARWQAVELTPLTRHNFAHRAATLRWDAEKPVVRLLGADELLKPLRYGDDKPDLWTTFNVVQEHLLRGGDRYMGYTPNMGVRRNTTRPVGSLTVGQKLNKQLWALAEEFAQD